ncbi:MAG: exonuclease domain-containing protein [Pseudomonadota bacterium]|nr:exonuclease domain-containing protein [Pseudomonadota bacterium]
MQRFFLLKTARLSLYLLEESEVDSRSSLVYNTIIINRLNMKRRSLVHRFRGLMPVVIDCETGGVNAKTDALLELAAVIVDYRDNKLVPVETFHYHVQPFVGANLDPQALEVTQIKPDHPFRFAQPEHEVLVDLHKKLKKWMHDLNCRRAVMVAQNAQFDFDFIQAALGRCSLQDDSPWHRFTTFDTATVGAVWLGEPVLARAVRKAGIDFDVNQAHSALYDAERTADFFCQIINQVDQRAR